MEMLTNSKMVEYLLRRQFPGSWAPPPLNSRYDASNDYRSKIEAKRAELQKLTYKELQARYQSALEVEQAKQLAAIEKRENEMFFNHPSATADFEYWAKLDYWSLDETVALLLAKAPEKVTWKSISSYVTSSKFARQFERIRQLGLRATSMNHGGSVSPAAALDWAVNMDIEIPAPLQAAVNTRALKASKKLATAPQGQPIPDPQLRRDLNAMRIPPANGMTTSSQWLKVDAPKSDAEPVLVTATETKEQRQDRRLQACVAAGLPMYEKAAGTRLPDGVGAVADREKISRQAFSTDVKAALKRRAQAQKEGLLVKRA